MCGITDLPQQLRLRPSKLQGSSKIPVPLIHGQIRLHDNHVLRPPNQESLMQNVRCSFIGPEKVPHPTEIPR